MDNLNYVGNFDKLTSNLTSFSHAYLINTNSLEKAYPYVRDFAKKIMCPNYKKGCEECNICFQIDNNIFDDFYLINPETLSIKKEEIDKLLDYFKTKSFRENGNRVYVVYGMERISPVMVNKLLKFIEEPENNIFGLIMTENIEMILPTIRSRCQELTIRFNDISNITNIELVKMFMNNLVDKKIDMIAFTSEYFDSFEKDRQKYYDFFETMEIIVKNQLLNVYNKEYNKELYLQRLSTFDISKLLAFMDIIENSKKLILSNVNLKLLIDRFIIEFVRGVLCKE